MDVCWLLWCIGGRAFTAAPRNQDYFDPNAAASSSRGPIQGNSDIKPGTGTDMDIKYNFEDGISLDRVPEVMGEGAPTGILRSERVGEEVRVKKEEFRRRKDERRTVGSTGTRPRAEDGDRMDVDDDAGSMVKTEPGSPELLRNAPPAAALDRRKEKERAADELTDRDMDVIMDAEGNRVDHDDEAARKRRDEEQREKMMLDLEEEMIEDYEEDMSEDFVAVRSMCAGLPIYQDVDDFERVSRRMSNKRSSHFSSQTLFQILSRTQPSRS